jgi:multiple sugar transport system substrate-binding protein
MKKLQLGLLVAAMILAACGPVGGDRTPAAVPDTPTAAEPVEEPTEAPAPEPASQERTAVRFAITDWQRPLYEDLIAAFEEENPDLRVEVVSVNEVLELGPIGQIEVPDDADQRLVAAADVVNIGVSRQVVRDGLLRDLSPFVEADLGFQADDFFPGTLERYQWDGGTWALPAQVDFRVIYYNKDAFDEAGVAYPEAGWTWDDLLVAAKAVTVREGDEVQRWGFVPVGLAYRLIESRAGALADEATDPPTPRLDEPDVVDAVRWYADLYLEEQVMPYFEPADEDTEALLSEEQALVDKAMAAMWPESDIVFGLRKQQGNVGVAPFPADVAGGPATPAYVDGLSMSAGTTQPEAAWRWIEFLSRQSLGDLGMGMQVLPARQSAAEASGFWEEVDEELASTLRYAVEHAYMTGEPVGYGAFTDALNAILKGDQSVEDALAEAQTQVEADLLEAAAERAGATPVPTFVVAAPELEEPASEGAVTITFVPGIGSLNLEPYRDLVDQFQEAHPDVAVEVKVADFVTGSTPTLKAMAEGSDCFEWYPGFQDPEQREAILSLKPFVDADAAFPAADFYPQASELFTWQGQLMGLPADIAPLIVEYSKDLFDAADLEYPAGDWTWDEFLAQSVALTEGEDEEKQYGFLAEVYELNDLLLITERLGAKLIDDSLDPPAPSYNDPDTVEAVRWYAGLTTEHGVKPVFLTDLTNLAGASSAYMEREGLINNGRAGMWTGSPTTAVLFGERSGMNLGMVALPVRAEGDSAAGFLTVSGYFISAQTEQRQACWQWITYLSDHPAAIQGLPARRSVAESDAYREQVGAERADAYLASVGDAERPSAFQLYTEEEWLGGALFWYSQAFGQVLEGKASVEDALDAAQDLADDYRACVVAGGDYGQEAWEACAKEVDPTLPAFLFATGQ